MIFKVVGTMSGTSFDGIDVALIETDGRDYIKLINGYTFPYNKIFSDRLKKATLYSCLNILELERDLTILHANAINEFLVAGSIDNKDIDYVGFHGQTILHAPDEGITYQIGNPHLLHANTGIKVVSDFRRKDIANGGCGAPLVPIFHQALARSRQLDNVVFLNIGGVSNITYIKGEQIIAFDSGPGNALIDDFLYSKIGQSFDTGGQLASKGIVDYNLVDKFLNDDFFTIQFPKSLDRERFKYLLNDVNHMDLVDGVATLSYCTVAAIKSSLGLLNNVNKIIVSGGGRKNLFLLNKIEETSGIETINVDDFGIDGDMVEAYAFGYLAVRTILELPISFPMTTGVNKPISLGSISW